MGIIIKPDIASCDVDGARVELVPNDVAEDQMDIDPQIPPGWVLMKAYRVVPNPAYAAEQEERAGFVQQQLEMAAAMAGVDPETVPEELQDRVATQAEMQMGEPVEAPYTVQQLDGVLSPKYAPWLQGKLSMDDWPAEEEEEEA